MWVRSITDQDIINDNYEIKKTLQNTRSKKAKSNLDIQPAFIYVAFSISNCGRRAVEFNIQNVENNFQIKLSA